MDIGSITRPSPSDSNFKYEHFPIVCPTCEGEGEIISEDHGGLISFVPVKDNRLKPAWTKLKICLLVLFLLTLGGTIVFFIFPRETEVDVTNCTVLSFAFHQRYPWILYKFNLTISNHNFYPVSLQNFLIQLYCDRYMVDSNKVTSIKVGLRTNKQISVFVNATYGKDISTYIRKTCYEARYLVGQYVQISSSLSYWMRSEQLMGKYYYFYMDCSEMLFPETTRTVITIVPLKTTIPPIFYHHKILKANADRTHYITPRRMLSTTLIGNTTTAMKNFEKLNS